jgi:hypothetical protein
MSDPFFRRGVPHAAGAAPQRDENPILSPWSGDLPPLQKLERGIEGVRTNRAATAIFKGVTHAANAPPQRNENSCGEPCVLRRGGLETHPETAVPCPYTNFPNSRLFSNGKVAK